jgi:hypothetical protein
MKPNRPLLVASLASLLVASGLALAKAPTGRYTAANGTVKDNKTGLLWQQAWTSSKFPWGSGPGTAQLYCANLSLAPGGWRLPTAKELQTLVDYSVPQGQPMIDPIFTNAPAATAWSSTPSFQTNYAWVVNFGNGFAGTNGSGSSGASNNVICVR